MSAYNKISPINAFGRYGRVSAKDGIALQWVTADTAVGLGNEDMSVDAVERLEAQLQDVHDVYIGSGWDAESYIAGLISSLREAICPPFAVTAEVEEPGFPDAKVGESISGDCVAHREGYWLVYQQENDRFLCFWGVDVAHLSAPGISALHWHAGHLNANCWRTAD